MYQIAFVYIHWERVRNKSDISMFHIIQTTIWSALDRGVLSGKYNKTIPKDGRLSGNNAIGAFVGHMKHVTKEKVDKVEKLMEIAKELDVSVAELAIAWTLKNSNVTVCILGGTKVYQLEQAMGSIAAANKMDKAVMDRIEKVLGTKPEPRILDRVWRESKQIISRL